MSRKMKGNEQDLFFEAFNRLCFVLLIFLILSTILIHFAPAIGKAIWKTVEFGVDKYRIALIQRELDPQWWESKKVWIAQLERAIERKRKEGKEGPTIASASVYELVRWYNMEVRDYNAAVMRYCNGVQYRGVEATFLKEIEM